MKNYIVILIVVGVFSFFMSACTSTSYRDPSGATFSRISFLNNQSVGKLTVKAGEKEKTLVLENYNSAQTEFAAAVVGAAVAAKAAP